MDTILVKFGELVSNLDVYSEAFLSSLGILGAVISCLLIIIESILPILPLCVFVTLVFYKFGPIAGFLLCWTCTCIGCIISFLLCRSKIKGWFERKILNGKKSKQVKKFMKYIDNISVSGLAILVAIPFTPAFVVNIAAGLSNITTKKFITGILIGKIFMIYFWGYIGTTLIESLTNPIYLVKILVMLLIAFVISKIANKYLHLD